MKVLTKILAAFMSVILVVLLTLTPLLSFAATAINKNIAHEIISDAEIKEEFLGLVLGEQYQDNTFIQAFCKSKCFDDIFTEAYNYLISPIFGEYKTFTSQDVMNIVQNNMDELIHIVRNTTPATIFWSDADIENAIKISLTGAIPVMMNEIENTKQEIWPTLIEAATILNQIKIIFYIVLGIIVLLTALIVLCTFRNFNAFIWLCVDYGIAAIFTFTTIAIMNIMLTGMPDFLTDASERVFISFIADKITSYFVNTGVIYITIFVLCLAAAIIFKNVFKKKKAVAVSVSGSEAPLLSDAQQPQPAPVVFSDTEEFTFVNSDDNN